MRIEPMEVYLKECQSKENALRRQQKIDRRNTKKPGKVHSRPAFGPGSIQQRTIDVRRSVD